MEGSIDMFLWISNKQLKTGCFIYVVGLLYIPVAVLGKVPQLSRQRQVTNKTCDVYLLNWEPVKQSKMQFS